jgi:hypothetical protein
MSQKQAESIWTKDITPHVVNFMTMDITPDFSGEVWTKDITHHVIGTLAVFGLVVSGLVTTAGVAAVGVNVEVALAQQTSVSSQTAAVMLGGIPVPPPVMQNASGTPMQHPPLLGMASSSVQFCPKIARTISRGSIDATLTGNVTQLQMFIAAHFNLPASTTVSGYFGSTTQAYLEKFQQEQGIPPAPTAGPLTRAAIARLCGQAGVHGQNGVGSSTPMMGNPPPMGSTTPPMPPQYDNMRAGSSTNGTTMPPLPKLPPPPTPPTTVPPPTPPVSYNNNDNASNAASVVEAVNEIGDGYGRLFTASLQLFGL